jgi:nucleotide-binding universal stress UspA family protein
MSKKFLVAIDGSDHGWKALDLATDLAKDSGAEVVVLHVVPFEPIPRGLERFAEVEGVPVEEERARYHYVKTIGDRITGEAETRARRNGLERVSTQVAEGNPTDMIVTTAKSEGVDMIFLGSRGLSNVTGLMMGSVSHKTMHLAPCTCVVVQ